MATAVSLEQVLSRLACEGELYEPLPEDRVRCYACGHRCLILPGHRGVCKVRWNEGGRLLVPAGYVAALQLDPIEKKPFFHAYPGARALSFGMLGCDYHCGFCFVAETPVFTAHGAVTIQTLFDACQHKFATADGQLGLPEGVEVITASGKQHPVVQVFKHRYQGPISVVTPRYLPAIRCTPDHRFFATTDPAGKEVREVAASDLTASHYLLVPKFLPSGERYREPRRGHRWGETERHFLVPVKSVTTEQFDGDVYNLEVAAEHSYLAGLVAVKNCQNHLTSQALRDPGAGGPPERVTAAQIVELARRHRARVLTSTYNEPLITSEWAVEVFRAGRAAGLTCSYVSNGNATPEVLEYLRPWVDLYKVDLKGFDDKHYRKLGGVLQVVLDTIGGLHARGFWVEVVTLVISGFNDSDGELRDIARFLASVSPDVPWHVTAFHRDYKMTDREDTDARTLLRAAEIGRAEGLRYVYAGNLPGQVGPFENTYCPGCQALLIERVGYRIVRDLLTPTRGACPACATRVAGVWA